MIETLFGLDKELDFIGVGKKEIIEALTLDDVKFFLESLNVSPIKVNIEKQYLICPTVCHNPLHEAESMKLYWYHDHKFFRCYTECNEFMSIFKFYQKFMALNYSPVTEDEAIIYVRNCIRHSLDLNQTRQPRIQWDTSKFKYDAHLPILKSYPKGALDCFINYHHPLWLKEGITDEVMDKFNIRFSIPQNKIIIPHYDLDGNLVGIRARTLNPQEIELTNMKYGPIMIGDTLYTHSLHLNLYGAYQHKQGIMLRKSAIIAEAEKSVLLDDVYYGPYSNTVACCGLSFNKYHISILADKLGANEIIVALDKEYEQWNDSDAKVYRARIETLCKRYSYKASFSYIWDFDNVLKRKDSPFDRGKEIFEHLYKTRVRIK